jgi:lysophospholipid acyltransferase (LPLAT)-like uncharacterized protein
VSEARRRWGSALGCLIGAYLKGVARTVTLGVTAAEPGFEVGSSCAGFAGQIVEDASIGHVIVPFWSVHQLTIALLATERFGLRPALECFEIVTDDSLGGEIMHRVGRSFGLRMHRIHTRGNPRRFEDLGSWLRTPASFFIAVDGGSTYGTVPTGTVRIAARLGSTVWPVAVRARPVLRCPGLVAEIPLPWASVALGVAAPLRVQEQSAMAALAEDLRRRIEAASEAARELLGPGRCAATIRRFRGRQSVT